MTNEHIVKAATIMKILYLARMQGMDITAVMLNRHPSNVEEKVAKAWAAAFELAQTDMTETKCAAELARSMELIGVGVRAQ